MYKVYEDHWGYLHVLDYEKPEQWLDCFRSFGEGYFWIPEEENELPRYFNKFLFHELKHYLSLAEQGDANGALMFLTNIDNDLGDEMWMERQDVKFYD